MEELYTPFQELQRQPNTGVEEKSWYHEGSARQGGYDKIID
jgi:hypothetical protein